MRACIEACVKLLTHCLSLAALAVWQAAAPARLHTSKLCCRDSLQLTSLSLPLALQYYFETIFPRIPKPVQDSMVAQLQAAQLPCKAVGNAGQGGADRRGLDEPNRRPASVKASLSVAFGQRAPNRATAREEGRGLGAGMRGTYGGGGGVVGDAAGEALRARWVTGAPGSLLSISATRKGSCLGGTALRLGGGPDLVWTHGP